MTARGIKNSIFDNSDKLWALILYPLINLQIKRTGFFNFRHYIFAGLLHILQVPIQISIHT